MAKEFDRAGAFMHGAIENGDKCVLAYTASTSGTTQKVEGDVMHAHLGEYTQIITDDGIVYEVCGFGLANRETGEVIKNSEEKNRRKVGEFEYAEMGDE